MGFLRNCCRGISAWHFSERTADQVYFSVVHFAKAAANYYVPLSRVRETISIGWRLAMEVSHEPSLASRVISEAARFYFRDAASYILIY